MGVTEAPIHHSLLHGTGYDIIRFNDHIGLPILIACIILCLIGMGIETYIRSRKNKHGKTS